MTTSESYCSELKLIKSNVDCVILHSGYHSLWVYTVVTKYTRLYMKLWFNRGKEFGENTCPPFPTSNKTRSKCPLHLPHLTTENDPWFLHNNNTSIYHCLHLRVFSGKKTTFLLYHNHLFTLTHCMSYF